MSSINHRSSNREMDFDWVRNFLWVGLKQFCHLHSFCYFLVLIVDNKHQSLCQLET